MLSLPDRLPRVDAVPRTSTLFAFRIHGQDTWTLCDRWNPNLRLLDHGAQAARTQGGRTV